MKKWPAYLLGTLVYLGLSSCNPKSYSLSNLPAEQIIFGQGGGFTGAVNTYLLLDNGQLFQKKSFQSEDWEVLEPLRPRHGRKMFRKIRKIDQDSMGIKEPGNRYFFLHYINAESRFENTWGKPDYVAPSELTELHAQLQELFNKAQESKQ